MFMGKQFKLFVIVIVIVIEKLSSEFLFPDYSVLDYILQRIEIMAKFSVESEIYINFMFMLAKG